MGRVAHDPSDLFALSARRVPTRWAGHPLTLLEHTGSTNDDARSAANAGAPHGFTVAADTQSAGRGRRGRTWHSPAGTSLYVSLLLRPRLAPADAPSIALAAGLAVRDALVPVVPGHAVTLKWPNDVRIGARKVAGVLVEGSVRAEQLAFVILGVGVNVNAQSLPEELQDIATSVRIARGEPLRRDDLLLALLSALENRVDALIRDGAAATMRAVSEHCDTLGTRVRIDGEEGVAIGISDSGALRVERDSGDIVEMHAGDVVPA